MERAAAAEAADSPQPESGAIVPEVVVEPSPELLQISNALVLKGLKLSESAKIPLPFGVPEPFSLETWASVHSQALAKVAVKRLPWLNNAVSDEFTVLFGFGSWALAIIARFVTQKYFAKKEPEPKPEEPKKDPTFIFESPRGASA